MSSINSVIYTSNCKRKNETQAIFLNPFSVFSSRKRNFVVRPFVDEETKKYIRLQTN